MFLKKLQLIEIMQRSMSYLSSGHARGSKGFLKFFFIFFREEKERRREEKEEEKRRLKEEERQRKEDDRQRKEEERQRKEEEKRKKEEEENRLRLMMIHERESGADVFDSMQVEVDMEELSMADVEYEDNLDHLDDLDEAEEDEPQKGKLFSF